MKRILALLLTLVMIVSLCACAKETSGSTDSTESGDTLPEDISEIKNLTADVTVTAPKGECYEGEVKLDLTGEEILATFTADEVLNTLCVSEGKVYQLEESEGGLPRGTVQDIEEGAPVGELTAEQLSPIIDVLLNKRDFTLDCLESLGILSEIKLVIAMYGITAVQLETAVNTVIDLMHDDSWQAEHFAVSTDTDGDDTTFSVETDLAKALLSLVSEAAKALGMEDKIKTPEEATAMPVKIEGKTTRDIPVELRLILTEDGAEYTVDMKLRSYNETEIDADTVKAKMAEAHGDYTECQECGLDIVYFRGYCENCVSEKFCLGFCGKEHSGGDGYCDDCRIPCAGGCGYHADHEEGYCYDCYYEIYCYNDCGREATHFNEYEGYCDECYVKCANCDNCADFDGVLCESCYRVAYCLYCDEPADIVSADGPDFSYGVCNECFVPCKECGENQGTEDLEGYCGGCYLKSRCYYCEGEPANLVEEDGYTFAFCDKCYARFMNGDIAI